MPRSLSHRRCLGIMRVLLGPTAIGAYGAGKSFRCARTRSGMCGESSSQNRDRQGVFYRALGGVFGACTLAILGLGDRHIRCRRHSENLDYLQRQGATRRLPVPSADGPGRPMRGSARSPGGSPTVVRRNLVTHASLPYHTNWLTNITFAFA